jgi:hypothetical protein
MKEVKAAEFIAKKNIQRRREVMNDQLQEMCEIGSREL